MSSARGARAPSCVFAAALGLIAWTLPIVAQRLSTEFRQAFEHEVRPLRTHAVVVRTGLPTAAIDNRDPVSGNVIVALAGADWKPVANLGQLPRMEEFLLQGEVLQLVRVTYSENLVDLRMVSLDPHKSIRGFSKPVVTTFRLTVPVAEDEIADIDKVPAALAALRPFLMTFGDEREARRFAATFIRR